MIYFFLNQYRALNVRIDLTYKSKFVKKQLVWKTFIRRGVVEII
jgi:hypothetical protein